MAGWFPSYRRFRRGLQVSLDDAREQGRRRIRRGRMGRARRELARGKRTEVGGRKMPEEEVVQRARRDEEEGKSPSTQAGEFVREEMHHVREGKHGARSPQQAIAIGLSKARRAGVKLPPPKRGSSHMRAQAERDTQRGRSSRERKPSRKRSRATLTALRREGHSAASPASLARQAHRAARQRGPRARRMAAARAVRTKGSVGLRKAARKGAQTRANRRDEA